MDPSVSADANGGGAGVDVSSGMTRDRPPQTYGPLPGYRGRGSAASSGSGSVPMSPRASRTRELCDSPRPRKVSRDITARIRDLDEEVVESVMVRHGGSTELANYEQAAATQREDVLQVRYAECEQQLSCRQAALEAYRTKLQDEYEGARAALAGERATCEAAIVHAQREATSEIAIRLHRQEEQAVGVHEAEGRLRATVVQEGTTLRAAHQEIAAQCAMIEVHTQRLSSEATSLARAESQLVHEKFEFRNEETVALQHQVLADQQRQLAVRRAQAGEHWEQEHLRLKTHEAEMVQRQSREAAADLHRGREQLTMQMAAVQAWNDYQKTEITDLRRQLQEAMDASRGVPDCPGAPASSRTGAGWPGST